MIDNSRQAKDEYASSSSTLKNFEELSFQKRRVGGAEGKVRASCDDLRLVTSTYADRRERVQ